MGQEKNGKIEPNFRSSVIEKEQVYLKRYNRSQWIDYDYI
jgi:hypothetical protein